MLAPDDWRAKWISVEREPKFSWDDGIFHWDFTLTGPRLDFLFRARAVGKTYGEAYVWSLVQQSSSEIVLLAKTRHYDAHQTPLVRETVLRRITLEDERGESLIGRRHELEVEAKGPLLITRFDGREVVRFTDASQHRGTIGVSVHGTDAAVIHQIRVTTDEGVVLAEDFANNDNPMSGGTVTADGLVVAGNVRMGRGGTSVPGAAPGMDIVFPLTAPAPLLRREFSVDGDVEAARLYVAAGGLPRIEINGVQINEAIEDGFTDYDHRVLYRTRDVTAALGQGENAIGVELGRGWYDLAEPNEWYWHMAPWRATPALLLQLEIVYTGGRRQLLVSDERWSWASGPTRHDSIYAGERYDARRAIPGWSRPGFDGATWNAVELMGGPKGKLVPARHEPIAVTRTIRPISLREVRPDVWVYDFGEIFAGRVRLEVDGPAGRTVSLIQHEKLNPDGTVRSYSSHIAAKIQVDRYTLAGDGPERWAPRFGYRGFRYVEMHGFPGTPTLDSLTGEVMHSDVATTARFGSSSDLLNEINTAARRTLLNNTHGFITDTPTFEKNGWTGDAHASALAGALNFDMTGVWAKWMADFRDAQAESGEIPEIVPSTPYYGYEDTPGWSVVNGPIPSWDAAALVIPNDLYHVTGNVRLLQSMYPTQKRLVDYTGKWFTEDFLYANPNNVFLGEYALYTPPGTDPLAAAKRRIANGNPPEPGGLDAVATAYYFHMTDLLARNAALLGYEHDAKHYAALAAAIRDAFNARYWDDAEGWYRTPAKRGERQPFLQYQNILPVAFGIVPDGRAAEVVAHVRDDLAANDFHLTSTGVFSGRYLMTLLTDYGYVDAAFQIATRIDSPSWGWWLTNGVNTMLEGWSLDSRSHDHHYWASVSSWLYQGLAGIRPAAPGYAEIVVRPAHPRGLDRVSAALDTVRGTISSSWQRRDGVVVLDVAIPADATAEVWCSKAGGGPIESPAGSVELRDEPGYVVFEVGAGEHRFRCSPR